MLPHVLGADAEVGGVVAGRVLEVVEGRGQGQAVGAVDVPGAYLESFIEYRVHAATVASDATERNGTVGVEESNAPH